MKKYAGGLIAVLACGIAVSLLQSAPDAAVPEERLSFQTGAKWQPRTHIQSDVAMVYGIGPALPERMKTWKERGYRIHVMTGVAWGQYQDYLNGEFDGADHWDEAQTARDGKSGLRAGRSAAIMSAGSPIPGDIPCPQT